MKMPTPLALVISVGLLAAWPGPEAARADPDRDTRRHGASTLGASLATPAEWTVRVAKDLGPRRTLTGLVGSSADGRAKLRAVRLEPGAPARSLEEALEYTKEAFLENCDLEGLESRRRHGMRVLESSGHGPINEEYTRFVITVAADPSGRGWVAVWVSSSWDDWDEHKATARRVVESLLPVG